MLNFSVYLSLLYFIILLTGFVNANAQKAYPFKITVNDSSTMEYQIDTLTKEQFGNSTRTLTKRTVPILYKKKTSTLESLSGIIHLDSCIKIEHKNNSITLCNRKGKNDRTGQLYKVLGSECGYIIFQNGGYEWWRYIIVDEETNEFYILPDQPVFIDCDYVYSQGNYYTEGQFKIIDLADRKHLRFDSFNWSLTTYFRHEIQYYFEFTTPNSPQLKKYARFEFE